MSEKFQKKQAKIKEFHEREKSIPYWKTKRFLDGANEHGGDKVDHEGNLRK